METKGYQYFVRITDIDLAGNCMLYIMAGLTGLPGKAR